MKDRNLLVFSAACLKDFYAKQHILTKEILYKFVSSSIFYNGPKVKMLLQTIFQQFLEVHLIQPFSRSYNENDKLKKIQTLFLKVGKNGKNSRLWHFLIQRRGKDKLLTLSRMSNKKLTNNHIFSCPGQLYR